jgi:hypothetical protein
MMARPPAKGSADVPEIKENLPMQNHRLAIDTLEPRRLLSADLGFTGAPTFIAVPDQTTFSTDTPRSIAFYDVSGIDQAIDRQNDADPANDVDLWDDNPLFSVFLGFEITGVSPVANPAQPGGGPENFEEISSIAVNPANGDVYVLSFDSGPAGVPDDVGDTQGDFDLYRINVAQIYSDFVNNDRSRGTMYIPQVAPDGFDYYAAYGTTATPAVDGGELNGDFGGQQLDGDLGIPAFRSNTDDDTTNDVAILPFVSEKIGEVARVQDGDFFNAQSIEFVDADTLVLMENNDQGALDHQIRLLQRLSTASGVAPGLSAGPSGDASDFVGGSNGVSTYAGTNYVPVGTDLTSESWVATALTGIYPDGYLTGTPDGSLDTETGGAFVNLDGTGESDVDGMAYVPYAGFLSGTGGVWVSDRDGTTGDEFAFFEIDTDAGTATLRELRVGTGPFPTDFNLDDDPAVNDNTGSVGFFDVDEAGNLLILERNFLGSDDPDTANPQIITRDVTDYEAGDADTNGIDEVAVGGFSASGPITNPTGIEDDTPEFPDLIFERDGAFERGNNLLYLLDNDGADAEDLYVIDADPASDTFGQVLYVELDAANHFLGGFNEDDTRAALRAFTLGDVFAQDGVVDARDIDALNALTGSDLLPAVVEAYDLTGDGVLTGGPAAGTDVSALVRDVIGTEFGDANLDGRVNLSDFLALRRSFGQSGVGFAGGDFNGDDNVNLSDFLVLRRNFGFTA